MISKEISKREIILLIFILIFSAIVRLYRIDTIPPSLYSDEASQGYNAYSILKTGKDEHGNFLPVSLRSFGDWKPPLPTYLMIPGIALFGLNEFSVRIPSVVLGIGSVYIAYLLIKELIKEKGSEKIALLGAWAMSISPWHILQSRASMLVIVSLFFVEAGILFFLKVSQNPKNLIFSSIMFALSIYAYYGTRIVTPLIIIVFLFYSRKWILENKRVSLAAFFIGVIILFPLLVSFIGNQNVIFGRAKTVSVFYDQGVKLKQWELITQDGTQQNPKVTLYFHNDTYLYAKDILERYLSHFDPRYLFFKGDGAYPFKIPNMGILYFVEGILIIIGITYLFNRKLETRFIIIFLILISIIPASLTFATPSSNRTFHLLFPASILIALGLYRISTSKIIAALSVLIYITSINYFFVQYFLVLPKDYTFVWNFGWKEVFAATRKYEKDSQYILVSDVNGMPYIYYLFYNQYDPLKFQKKVVRTNIADRFGFEHINSIDKYIFLPEFDWNSIKDSPLPNSIYIASQKEIENNAGITEIVYYPNGKEVWKIVKSP